MFKFLHRLWRKLRRPLPEDMERSIYLYGADLLFGKGPIGQHGLRPEHSPQNIEISVYDFADSDPRAGLCVPTNYSFLAVGVQEAELSLHGDARSRHQNILGVIRVGPSELRTVVLQYDWCEGRGHAHIFGLNEQHRR